MEINYETLANECGLSNPDNLQETVSSIEKLQTRYDNSDLVDIYNYFLATCKYPNKLSEIIRYEDRIRDKKSLSALIDILLGKIDADNDVNLDDYVNTRVMAAKAIANLKDTTAVNALLYCLNNKKENYKIRFACADALGKIGDKYAVAPLIEVVRDEDEKSVYLRESAASALGMLGDLRAVESLVGILETKNGLIDKFTFLKERVLEALGKLNVGGNKRVFNALKKSLKDESPQIRINAIEALMESGCEEAVSLIKESLDDNNDEVKQNALIALYNMKGRQILDEIISENRYGEYVNNEARLLIDEYENDEAEQ